MPPSLMAAVSAPPVAALSPPPPGVVDPAAEERVTPRRPPEGRLQPAGVEWPLDIAGEEKTHRIARAAVPQQELLKRGERAGRGHGAGEACRGEGSRKPRPYRQPGGGGSARSIGSRGLGLRPARVNPDNSPRLRERFGGFLDSQRPLSILVFPRLIRDRASWPPSTAPRRGCRPVDQEVPSPVVRGFKATVYGQASVAGDGCFSPFRPARSPRNRWSWPGVGVDPTDGLLADEHPDPRTDLIDPF